MDRHSTCDRHLDSDTRFSRGMWETKQGVNIRWAQSSFKTQIDQDGIYNLSATMPLRGSRGAQLNNPTITTKLTSPFEGIVGVESYHHYSQFNSSSEPRYELQKTAAKNHFTTEKKTDFTELNAGDIVAKVSNSERFGIDFVGSDEKLYTKLGFRSVGWVEDLRYRAVDGTSNQTYTTVQLHVLNGEKIYGLGERFGPFVKNGQRVEMWNEDGGTSSEWTYKNVPFYISSRGYGVFVDLSAAATFEIQSERTTRVNIAVPAEGIRYYIIAGPDPKTILRRYAQLTGFPALPPPWTFGLWLTTSFTTDYDLKTVSGFLQGMRDRKIPLAAFHFDCFWMKGFQWCDFQFDPEHFPDPKGMLAQLKKDYGVKICVWINPYIGQELSLFKLADEKGYLIRSADGRTSYQTDLWQAGMGIVDFTNPAARSWYQQCLAGLVDLGVDLFKTDFGERIPIKNVSYFDKSDPVAMHNYYAVLYNQTVFEILEKKLGRTQACVFARAASAGSQRFPVHWGGDCELTFEAMAESLRGGLSLGLSAFGFWSHDIGGFEGIDLPDPSLYKRWCQFGLLSSHSRLHGSATYRVPWNIDDEASEVLALFTKLKLSLMPYIYGLAIEAHTAAVPVMRALMLEFPKDLTALTVDSQFMLGPLLLVCPITSPDGEVTYYLPLGDWYGYLDGKVRSSVGQWVTETHDVFNLPLLVRPNSVFVSASSTELSTPDYNYADDCYINVYALEGETVVKVPDSKKLGSFAAEIAVKNTHGTILATVKSGSLKKWAVRVLDGKVEGSESDKLGNAVVPAKGLSVKFELVI